MPLTCQFGLHDWRERATARAGVTVYRCARCNAFARTSQGRRRRKKRHYLLGAALVSVLLWYVIIALGLTGHTKVLWGAEHAARGIDHVAGKIDHKIKKAAGAPQPF